MLIEKVGLKFVQVDKCYWARAGWLYGKWLKIEATHLRCKTVNNLLIVCERVEMIKRNGVAPLPSPCALWIASACKRKPR